MSKLSSALSVKEIHVELLFGQFTYRIPGDSRVDISRLLMIYGDNGSGKTTILKLIFWLLSSRDGSGYKSKLAQTKFKKISVCFSNGTEVGASRDKDLIGGYDYYIKTKQKKLQIHLKADNNLSVTLKSTSEEGKTFLAILNAIKALNVSVLYLSDERKIFDSLTSSANSSEFFDKVIVNDNEIRISNSYEKAMKKGDTESRLSLIPAIDRLNDWIKTKAITDSRTGEKNSQVIFTDLIKNFLLNSDNENSKINNKKNLLLEISKIEASTVPYIGLGLLEPFDSETIITAVQKAKNREQIEHLITIVRPYLESIDAKLKALESLKDTLLLFLESVNQYFFNKTLKFNLNTSFSLVQRNGESIDLDSLSSGEKQLLLLFIHTITVSDETTIFVIDEPEISLNVKWQRSLNDTLLKFSLGKKIQYIIATHSLELLSSNFDKVTKLEDLS